MIVAITYIILFLGISLIIFLNHKILVMNSILKKIIFGIFIISLSVIAYNISAPSNWDLGRNYLLLDVIRDSGLSFRQFVFGGAATYNADGDRTLIVYNIYRYIIVHIFKNNVWYQTITTIIVYLLAGYIIFDYKKDKKKKSSSIIIILLMSFTYLPFLYITSGVRNALAASITGVATYMYLYRKENILLFICEIIAAAMIHPSILVVVPFAFLAKMHMGRKGAILVIMFLTILKYIAVLLSKVNIRYLAGIGRSYLIYTGGNRYKGGRGHLYGIIIITAIFIMYFMIEYRKNNVGCLQKDKVAVEDFILYMMVYMIGNFQNYDLVLRPGYIVGMFAPFLVDQMIEKKPKNSFNKALKVGSNMLIVLMCVYVNYKCMQIFLEAFR